MPVHETEEEHWQYNAKDCVYTREIGEVTLNSISILGLEEQHAFLQQMFWPVLYAMQRGVRVDNERKARLSLEIQEEISKVEMMFMQVLGHPLNPASPKQMHGLFYGDLRQPVIMTRAAKGKPPRPTLNDDALKTLGNREPLLQPLLKAIANYRTLGVFNSTFLKAKTGLDGRMRTSYNICGTKTLRLSSSKDAFGEGANLENIPSEKSKTMGKAAARGMEFELPNIRSLYIPDPGYTFFDGDLDRADLHVVIWEAKDELLKIALRLGVDTHLLNVYTLDNQEPPPLEELVETHPRYPDHRGPRKLKREFSKVFCHATDYLGSARTVASHTGRTVHEVDRAQRIWFGAHPGIQAWHKEVAAQASGRGYVENKFGFRWYIFDRIDTVLPEAVAWIPQSTVGIVINKIWLNFWNHLHPRVETLLQTHDSLSGQIPNHLVGQLVPQMKEHAKIVVPYDDPLVIPFSLKTSPISWGDC